jgi:hypothetical protein
LCSTYKHLQRKGCFEGFGFVTFREKKSVDMLLANVDQYGNPITFFKDELEISFKESHRSNTEIAENSLHDRITARGVFPFSPLFQVKDGFYAANSPLNSVSSERHC